MVTKMTRAEYEAKYGTPPPVSSAAPTTTSTVAPIKMTRAEYQAKYGVAPAQAQPVASAWFPSSATDNPLEAGAKALGNLPKSVYGVGKGLYDVGKDPIETAKSARNIVAGATQTALNKIFDKNVQTEESTQFNAFTQMLKERYGSLEALQKTATEDPFAFGTDVLSVIEGGAGLAGKTAQLNKAIGTAGKLATTPVTRTAGKIADTVGDATKFGVSQATGLNADTITELVKNPQAFKNLNPELRVETATKVADALDSRLSELSDMGKGYQTIRESGGLVTIPPDTIKTVLNKYGVKLDEGNKIITSPESRPLSAGDRVALQDFIDNYGGVTTHTNNSFLNTREALSNLAKYDSTKTNLSTQISRDLRAEFDKFGKAQIPGLKDLDTAYAPERELLGQLKKDIFDAKGELKDAAISKIANLTGKGKEQVLERVKQVVPDIEERVNLIKAVEDIERASGFFKTGTYIRGAVTGGAVLTGNVPAIIGAILAQPSIAVPLLKGAGYVGQKAAPILEVIKGIANDVNNFRLPKPLLNENGQLKAGLSAEAVTPELVAKRVDGEDLKLIREFVNKPTLDTYLNAQPIIEGAGIYGMDTQTMQRFLKEVVDLNTKKLSVKTTTPTYTKGTAGKFTGSVSGDPLITEARKYKSAEEFVKAKTPVYHGSPVPLKKFSNKKGGAFFTEEYADATGFAGSPDNVYEGYLNFEKPLVIDAKGAKWDDLNTGYGKSTQEVISNAQKDGYDGVVFKNVIDNIADDAEAGMPGTIYYAYKPENSFINESQLTDIWKKANGKN